MKTTLRNTWISGAGLAAVLLVSGLTPVEARAIADDHSAAHAEQSRDAGEVVNDSWITTKVKSKLVADGDVSGFDISVETRNNVVHLSGEVETQAQVDHAVSIARDTEGVARVDATELRFDTAVGQVRDAVAGSDEEFRSQPMSTQAPEAQPQPESRYEDRARTTTEPDAQRQAESNTGRDTTTMGTDRDRTTGQAGDTDRGMGEAAGDAWITTKVNAKLLADGDVSAFDISVETRDDVVHLDGEVETQAHYDTAVRLARETEGVARVDSSQLRVTGAGDDARR